MIKDLLTNKTSQEKSRIKSEEISKLNHVGKFTEKGFEIEIISLNPIEQDGQFGIEIYAKAWKDGKPVGLGGGTVETERFIIFNPCNLAIGNADDSPTRLRAMADYLEKTMFRRKQQQIISKRTFSYEKIGVMLSFTL